MDNRILYKVVGKWANGKDHTLITTENQKEANEFHLTFIKRWPQRISKTVRITEETIASYEPETYTEGE